MTNGHPDGYSMLDRPWSAEEQARLDAIPIFDPVAHIPAPEPIEGWGPEEQWRSIVGTEVPDTIGVPPPPRITKSTGAVIEPLGPSSWKVQAFPGMFIFRSVDAHRELHADVEVRTGEIMLIRTSMSLGLTARNTLVKALWAAVRQGVGTLEQWTDAVNDSIHAVLEAVGSLSDGVDLRLGEIAEAGSAWVCEPLWSTGATMLVMPGEAGKSTLARAMAVSITSGRMVVPGLYPRITGPVLYIASEDPGAENHRRSIEAICRGAGIDRRQLGHEIRLVASRGMPLHHLARDIAERSRDYAGVVLDAMQGLLPGGESGVRDQAATFWGAIDEIGKPVFVVAHPNLSQARGWKEADGRAAGSEVNRDRARLSWMGRSTDLPSEGSVYHRQFSMECTKWNDGDKTSIGLAFKRTWAPGIVTFSPADAVESRNGLAADIEVILTEHPFRAREIGERLGVSQQTVNTTCGRKPEIFFRTQTGDWSLVGWTL